MKTKNTTMRKLFLATLLVATTLTTSAQIGIGTTNPNPWAALDISSDSKGLLIPKLTTVQRDAITNPIIGLMIFNITNIAFEYYVNATTGWSNISATNRGFSVNVVNRHYLRIDGGGFIFSTDNPLIGYKHRLRKGTFAAPTATAAGRTYEGQYMGHNGTDYTEIAGIYITQTQTSPIGTSSNLAGRYEIRMKKSHDNSGGNANILSLQSDGNGFIQNNLIVGLDIQTPEVNAAGGIKYNAAFESSGYIKVGSADALADNLPTATTEDIARKAGMIRYNSTTNKFQGFTLDMDGNGTADDAGWVNLN